jgi:hypothetical protein
MKTTAIITTALIALSPFAAFAANKVGLSSSSNGTVTTNAQTYLILSVFDDKGMGLENPKILVKQTPSYLLDIGNFVGCSTAEGQELCPKADQSLAGLKGAFVAKVASKEKEGTAKIDVYVDGAVSTIQIQVGAATTQAATTALVATVEEPTTTAVEDVKAGGQTQGIAFGILAMIASMGVMYASYKKNRA